MKWDVKPVDGRLELVELIEALFLRTPVVLVTPIVDELLDVAQVRAVLPPGIRDLVWEPHLREALLEIGENCVRDLDRERYDGRRLG